MTRGLALANSIVFETKPFVQNTIVSGLFSANLDITTNKRDLDIAITLFDIKPDGEWVQLSYDWQRASFAANPAHRRLLSPGRRIHVKLMARCTTSRLLGAGDQVAVSIRIVKQPGEEINYGTGRPASTETIADAGEPLQIRWWCDSSIDVPQHHP